MPVTVLEKFDSRASTTGANASVELTYTIRGTDDDTVAKAQLLIDSPATYDGLVRQSAEIEPVDGRDLWNGTVRYGVAKPAERPETGDSSFSFDTGGGTQHITQSLQTVAKYAASGTAPDYGGAIGVTHDSVQGVDITVPVYNFAETHYLADAVVTLAYRGTLFRLTGKVNNAAFKGLDAGECLFLGASGSKRGEEDWEITFRFAGSENKTGLTVGEITGIAKKGWEYMWVRYEDAEDDTAKALVKKPVAVYIEKVYEDGDFSGLGIGA
ncbi:MAG: hypothetical protein JXL80_00305 [Planctomycetes bacterium]|nr:hypothetical protein [Planctomycetota bacterium]